MTGYPQVTIDSSLNVKLPGLYIGQLEPTTPQYYGWDRPEAFRLLAGYNNRVGYIKVTDLLTGGQSFTYGPTAYDSLQAAVQALCEKLLPGSLLW